MKNKIYKLLSILLTVAIIASTCVCAFGTVAFATEDETYDAIYYVSAGGSDENDGTTSDAPVATYGKALELAAALYGAGDAVNIKLMGESVDLGTMAAYDFDLTTEGIEETATQLSSTASTVIFPKSSGITRFRNVQFYSSSQYTSFMFGDSNNIVLESTVTGLSSGYKYTGLGTYNDGGAATTVDGVNFEANTHIYLLYMGSAGYQSKTFTEDVNVTLAGGGSTNLYFNPAANCSAIYKKNLNLNLEKVTGVTFTNPGTLKMDGAVQVINSCGATLNKIDELVKTVTVDEETTTVAVDKYIINNNTGDFDIISFTETAGVYSIKEGYNVSVTKTGSDEVVASASAPYGTTDAVLDITGEGLGTGEYDLTATKIPETKTYYVGADVTAPEGETLYATVDEAVAAAISDGLIKGDTADITVLSASTWTTDTARDFKVYLHSSTGNKYTVKYGTTFNFAGDAELQDLTFSYTSNWGSVMFAGKNITIGNNVDTTTNYSFAMGTNAGGTCGAQTVHINNAFTSKTFRLGMRNNSTLTYTDDVNLYIDNASAAPGIGFASDYSSNKLVLANDAHDVNYNIIVNKAKSLTISSSVAGVALPTTINGAIQLVIDEPDTTTVSADSISYLSTAATITKGVYVVKNSTGFDNAIDVVKNAVGVFNVAIEKNMYTLNVTDTNGVAVSDAVITENDNGYTVTLPTAGEYTIEKVRKQASAEYSVATDGDYTTVAAAVQAAVDKGYIAGDIITVKVSGETADLGTLPVYAFDLIVESADAETKTTVLCGTGTFALANNEGATTYYKNVTLSNSSTQWKTAIFNSSNLSFDENVTFSFGYGTAVHFGAGNDGGAAKSIAGQSLYLASATLPYRINLSNSSWSSRTYTEDVNITVNNSKISPIFLFNAYYSSAASGTTKYNKNVNIILKAAKGIGFDQLDGATFTGGLQIINHAGITIDENTTGYASLPTNTWIINNVTGNADAISVTETAGIYNVSEDVTIYVYKGTQWQNVSVVDGVLDLTALGAGQYTIRSEMAHIYDTYVSDNNATCTEDGTETAVCGCGCGETDTRVLEGSALGHSFTEYVYNNDETCTEDGTKTAKCERFDVCGETDTLTAEGTATGHSFTNYEISTPATCTEDAIETAVCDNCDTTDTRTAVGTALGHTYDDDADLECNVCGAVRKIGTFFVSATGNDANDATANTDDKAALTLQGAVQAAIDAGYVAGDTVTVKVVGTTAVAWGEYVDKKATIPEYAFKLIVTSETSGATVGDNLGGVVFGGDIDFENITVWCSSYPTYLTIAFNDHEVNFASDTTIKTLNVANIVIGSNSTYNTVEKPLTYNVNTGIKYFKLSNDYNSKTYNADVTLNLSDTRASASDTPIVYLTASNGVTTYNANVNINIKDAPAFALSQGEKAPAFGENGALQIINSAGVAITDSKGILTGAAAGKYYILNNTTGLDLVGFTSTTGKYEVLVNSARYQVSAVPAEGEAIVAVDGFLTVPAGEYTLAIKKLPEYKTYNVAADGEYTTVAAAVQAALDAGYLAGDTITVAVSGDAVDIGTLPAYQFDLIVESADAETKTTVNGTTLANNEGATTYYKNVTIGNNSAQWKTAIFNSSNLSFDENVTFSFGYGTAVHFGASNDGGAAKSIAGQSLYLASTTLPYRINLSNASWSGRTYTEDVNVTVNNSKISPIFLFNAYYSSAASGTTKYNKNVNFILKAAKGIGFDQLDGTTFTGGLQIINHAGITIDENTTGYASLPTNTWIINNVTGNADAISVTATAGIYNVPEDVTIYVYKGTQWQNVSVVDGVLDLTALGAGQYTIRSEMAHIYDTYVSDNNATCTEDGTETAVCGCGCGETDTRVLEGSALGHSFTEYVYNNDETCTEDGTKTAKCERFDVCGETDTVTAEGTATGHTYDDAMDNECNVCGHIRPLPFYDVVTGGTYATVLAAVEQAIADGFGEGDTVEISVAGESVTFGGNLPAYSFDLIIESAASTERTKIIIASAQVIANNEGHTTYYKNVEINNNSTQWTSVQLNSSSTYFDENTTFNLGYGTYLTFGTGNDGGAAKSIAGQSMYIATGMPYAINFANHNWSGRKYTEDVNLTVNTSGTPNILFNAYYSGAASGTTQYQKNVNIVLNKASGLKFDQLDGTTFVGGVQIMNHAGLTLDAATLGTPVANTWVINNGTDDKNIITTTETAGTFALNYDAEEGKVTVTDSEGNKTYAEGDTVTLAAGTYTIGYESSHTYTNYVSDGNATCTENGTETAKCDCGCERTNTREDEDSALGHSFTNYVYNEDATCTEDGTKTAKCDRCDVTETVTATGSATGHSYGEYEVTLEPGCTTTGTETATCQNGCGSTATHELAALGHIYDDVNDTVCNRCDFTREIGEFFVSATGSDENDATANTDDKAALTLQGAVQAAINTNNYGAGDTVYVKVVGTTAVAWGVLADGATIYTIPEYEFNLIVTSETSGATVGDNTGSVILGGDIEFQNITVWVATYPKYYSMFFNDHNVKFGSDVTYKTLNVSYLFTGKNSGNATIDKPINVEMNTNFNYFYFGNDYHTRTYNKDINFVSNSSAATALMYLSNRQLTTFNANLNLNFKKASTITLTYGSTAPAFGENAALQIINSTGVAITDSMGILTSLPAYKKFVINNVSGNADLLSYTATAGKYAVNVDLAMYEVIATAADGTTYKAADGFLTVPAGEYTVDTIKVPLYKTYYVETGADGSNDTYATVAAAIDAAVAQGYIKGDVITIKLLGESVENGTYSAYPFDLIIEGSTIEVEATETTEATTKPTRLVITSNTIAYNEGMTTTYKNVEIYKSGTWNSFTLQSSNAVFESDVKFTHDYLTVAFGSGNDGGAGKNISGQSFIYKASGIYTINLANGSWSGRKYNADVNLEIDNAAASPQIAFNSYYSGAKSGSTTYNKNVNINVKDASKITFIHPDGATFNGAIQIINSTAVAIDSNTGALANFTCPKYIITNKTGDKEIITTTETTGVYTIAGDKVVRAINMTNGGYADSAEGVLDVSALGAGEYVLAFPTDYSAYEATNNCAEYIVDRTALNGNHALNNVAAKINKGEHINVVYYGGSVTAGTGSSWGDRTSWRGQISTWLEVNAPNSSVTNINSAIGGTGTFFGTYRLQEAVLDKQPDLLFIEFSINDFYDNQTTYDVDATEAARRFESIIRRVRTELPECDIVMLLTTERGLINDLKNDDALHAQAQGHDSIAEAYGIPALRVGHALADTLSDTWADNNYAEWYEYVTDIVHPNDKGYAVYYNVVNEYMANSLFATNKAVTEVKAHTVPDETVSETLIDGNIQVHEVSEEMSAASETLGGDTFELVNYTTVKYFDNHFVLGSNTLAFEFTGTELGIVTHSTDNGKTYNVVITEKESGTEVLNDTVTITSVKPGILASGLPLGTYVAKISANFPATSDWAWIYGFTTRDQTQQTSKDVIYYVSADGSDENAGTAGEPLATVAKAIELANARGSILNNHVTIKVAGESVDLGTYPAYTFDLVVESADADVKTKISSASGVYLANNEGYNTTYKNVEITNNSGEWKSLYLGSGNAVFESDVKFSLGYGTSIYYGANNDGGSSKSIAGQSVVYKASGLPYSINLSNANWAARTYTDDVNLTVDTASGVNVAFNAYYNGAVNGTTNYNKDVNIVLNNPTGVSFTNLDGVTFGGAVQVINSGSYVIGENTTGYDKLPENTWILNNTSGDDNLLTLTNTAGVYTVSGIDFARYYVVATNENGTTVKSSGKTLTLTYPGTYEVVVTRDTESGIYIAETDTEYSTVADAVQAAIDAGYSAGDEVVVKTIGTDVNMGTLPEYTFDLVVDSYDPTVTTKITLDSSLQIANNEGAKTTYKNVEIYNAAQYSNIQLDSSNVVFSEDTVINAKYGAVVFGGAANDGGAAKTIASQTAVFNGNLPSYINLSNAGWSGRTYSGDVNLVVNSNGYSSTIYFNAYYDGVANGSTKYNGNININIKDASSIGFGQLDGASLGENSAIQLIVNANTTISDTSLSAIKGLNPAKGFYHIIDATFQRRIVDFTDTVGIYTVDTEYVVTATNTEGVVVESVNGVLDLSDYVGGTWTLTTNTYFEDFDDTTMEELKKDWKFSSDSSSISDTTKIVDGALQIATNHNLVEIPAFNTNKNIASKDQYISVDMKGDKFNLYNGLAILARLGGSNIRENYQFLIANGYAQLTKIDGVNKNTNGYFVTSTEGFDFTGLYGRLPGSIDDVKNTFTFNPNHTYRVSLSVVDAEENGAEIAYVRAILLNVTTNELMFDETFKDTAPYQGTGFSVIGRGNDPVIYIDNLYFSSEEFREGDAGTPNGDINFDSLYDVRDLVCANESITDSTVKVNINMADKDADGAVDAEDVAKIRKEILTGYVPEEFGLTGNSDAEAATMRENILNSESTIVDHGDGTYTYTATSIVRDASEESGYRTDTATYTRTGTVWYVAVNNEPDYEGDGSKDNPWTLDQMNANASKYKSTDTTATIKSGDAVLFKRGDEFRLVDTMTREEAVSGSTTDSYSYIIAQSDVLYGAYGEGAKPKFNDSAYNYATEKTWTAVEGQENLYVTDAPEVIIDLGDGSEYDRGREGVANSENSATNILFTRNGSTTVEIGQRRSFTSATNLYTMYKDMQFTYDESTGKLYVYSTAGNPNDVFSSMEVSRGLGGINLNAHCSGFVIDNLEFQGFGNGAVYGAYGNNDITVTNCEFGYSGGTQQTYTDDANAALRFGNAVGLWCGGSDFKVNYNWIYQTFDSAISPQGNTAISYDGFEVKGNLLEYNNCDIEIFDRGTAKDSDGNVVQRDATWNNCDWSNNIMRFTTLGWGSREVDKIRGIQGVVRGSVTDASIVDIDWTNNIIDTPGMEIFRFNNSTTYEVETDADGNETTVYTGIFKFGDSFTAEGSETTAGESLLGNNTYYLNPYVRNIRLLAREYMTYVPGTVVDEEGNVVAESTNRVGTTADEAYTSIQAVDSSVGGTSNVYWMGQLVSAPVAE